MRKQLLLLAFLAFISTASFAQSSGYQTAAGIKFWPGALTIKHFVKEKAAAEGLLYFWTYGMRITGLYEFHGDIKEVAGLRWYVGPGAHIGFYNNTWLNKYDPYNEYSSAHFGIDGVVGLDYKIATAPINLTLDWQPSFNIAGGYTGFEGGFGGIGVRYTFR